MSATAFQFLLFGLDTVECSYYLLPVEGPGIDFEALALKKEIFRLAKNKDPMLVNLGGTDFLLQGYGTKSGYPHVLENRDFTIRCGEFNNPPFFVTFRSEALWRNTALGMHERFLAWAHCLGYREEERNPHVLGRVDFTFDYQLSNVDFAEESFVTLASKESKHRTDRVMTGVAFGTGDARLRVNDKTLEIAEASHKVWFFDLWGCEESVWRIEWQTRKDLLRRFGIRTFDDLMSLQGDVLRYLSSEHDTLRIPNGDSNRSRWPLHPLWRDLQAQIAKLDAQGVIRVVDEQAMLQERLMRIAISTYGNLKRVAAIYGLLNGNDRVRQVEAVRHLADLLYKTHDPLTWDTDVKQRMDQMRLGQ
ncbi:MAG: hypothetical protein SGJ20_20605 [Planctomycetota bacterium]|nr:hypothetical protein [Planctomycetota bacterium]